MAACHACGSEFQSRERVGFRDTCGQCAADLHVCLNCHHHDVTAYNECRESSSERILDKDRANRCEYFRPSSGPRATGDDRDEAMSDLENLFKKG